MISLPSLLAFCGAVLVLQASPGPDMMFVIGRGVGQGRRVAFLTVVGGTILAAFIQLPLLAVGLASIIKGSPLAFGALKWIGAAYLIWLGVKLFTNARQRRWVVAPVAAVSDWAAIRQGMVSNLTNPKVLLFMLVFLPQFVDPASHWPVASQLLFLGALQKTMGFFVLSAIAFAAGSVGGWLARSPVLAVWQERFAAVIMIGLGLRIAFGGDMRAA